MKMFTPWKSAKNGVENLFQGGCWEILTLTSLEMPTNLFGNVPANHVRKNARRCKNEGARGKPPSRKEGTNRAGGGRGRGQRKNTSGETCGNHQNGGIINKQQKLKEKTTEITKEGNRNARRKIDQQIHYFFYACTNYAKDLF